MVIAIDGPAGSGKSTTAKSVAARLGIMHLDTGAMYRAITLKALREGIAASDEKKLAALMARTGVALRGTPPDTRVLLDGEDVTVAVRGDYVTKQVSDYCQPAAVRDALVGIQRETGSRYSCVCEGRDIGTVVFPDAALKFFMVASIGERARRRQRDFRKMGVEKTIDELVEEIRRRDAKDSTRANSPLTKADDAEEVDTTNMTIDEQVDYIVAKAKPLLAVSDAAHDTALT